jgi:PAS domain S-box-containing protein
MIAAPITSRESARLAALYRYHILDTSSEPAFDELASLAAYVCRAPIAVISFVDSSRQWFKSTVGLSFADCPRSEAFCAHTILGTDLFIVEDVAADKRFADHPWVVESPSISFYAGVPLITPDGHTIGSLAVMDVVPRTVTHEQRTGMHTLAKQVMAQLELRRGRTALDTPPVESKVPAALSQTDNNWTGEQERSKREMLLTLMLNTWPGCIKRVAADGTLLHMNPAGLKLIEACAEQEVVGRSVFDLVLPEHRDAFVRMHRDVIGGAARTLQFKVQGIKGACRWMETHAVPFHNPVSGCTEHLAITEDITERKQVEDALRQSEERLRFALETGRIGAWDLNLVTHRAHRSLEHDRIFGYPTMLAEWSYDQFLEHVLPDDREQVNEKFLLAIADRSDWSFECRIRRIDGQTRWIWAAGRHQVDDAGAVRGMAGIVQDITDRKMAEVAVRVSEERYALAVRGTSDGIWDWDILSGEDYLSARWKELLGFTDDELPNDQASFFERLHPDDSDRVRMAVEAHLAARRPYNLECRLRHKDGTYRWVQSRGQALWDEQGQATRMVGAITDITERKQIEAVLYEQRQRLQAIVEGTSDAVFIRDLQGKYLLANAAVGHFVGKQSSEVIGQDDTFIFSPEDARAVMEGDRRVMAGGTTLTYEDQVTTPDGVRRTFSTTKGPLFDQQGAVSGIFGISRDITGQKHVEELIRQSEARFRQLANTVPVLIWMADTTKACTWFNDAWLAFTGRTVAQEYGNGWTEGVHPDDVQRCRETYGTAFDRRESFEMEYRLRHYDGTYHWLLNRGTPQYDVAGVFTGYIGGCADIQDQRDTAEALRQTEERWAYAFEGSGDGVWDWNAVTNKVFFSHRWKDMLGYAPEEIGDSLEEWSSRVHPDDLPLAMADVQRHFRGEAALYLNEHRMRCKDGSYKWILDRGKVISRNADGTPLRMVGTHKDITDRKCAEEALRTSEERYRQYFELSLIGMAVTSLEKGWIQVNDRLCEIFGYSRQELTTKTWTELTHPDDIAPDVAQFNRVLAGEINGYSMDKRFIHQDGHVIYASISARAVRRPDGPIDHFVAHVQDVTARHEAEQRLTDSEQLLQRQISEMPIGHIMWDHEFRVQSWNPAAKQIFGYRADEAIGRHGAFLIPEEYRLYTDELWQRLLAGDKTAHSVNGNLTKDGHRVICQWSNTPLQNSNGAVIGVLSMVTDVTDRKRAEEALRLTQFSVDHASDSIFWIDADARILDVNEAACMTLGYSREELLSKTVHDIDPLFPAEAWPAHWAELKARKSFTLESVYTRKDGSIIQTEVTVNYLVHEGREYSCAFMRDVTARKEAYASLKAAYGRLQQMSRELQIVESNERSRLSRELHDEVGQLLTGVKFDLEAARKELVKQSSSASKRSYGKILRALESTGQLFSRLRRIVRALRPPILDQLGLKAALHAMMEDLQAHSGLICSISLEIDTEPASADTTVEMALYRIAQELTTNVVRHASAMSLSLILVQDEQDWVMIVQDDGTGFDTGKDVTEGMGLRGIRERMEILGGHVDISSGLGAGTIVTARVPKETGCPSVKRSSVKPAQSTARRLRRKQVND